MPRIKRGLGHLKRRKNILKRTKGFQGGRKKLLKVAKMASTKGGAHAYRDRRVKKRLARGLFQVKINAAVRSFGLSYAKFMGAMKTKKILLDRKVLSQMAEKQPAMFAKIVEMVK